MRRAPFVLPLRFGIPKPNGAAGLEPGARALASRPACRPRRVSRVSGLRRLLGPCTWPLWWGAGGDPEPAWPTAPRWRFATDGRRHCGGGATTHARILPTILWGARGTPAPASGAAPWRFHRRLDADLALGRLRARRRAGCAGRPADSSPRGNLLRPDGRAGAQSASLDEREKPRAPASPSFRWPNGSGAWPGTATAPSGSDARDSPDRRGEGLGAGARGPRYPARWSRGGGPHRRGASSPLRASLWALRWLTGGRASARIFRWARGRLAKDVRRPTTSLTDDLPE